MSSFFSSDVQTTVIPGPPMANRVAATRDVKLFLAGDATVQSEVFGSATVLVDLAHRAELLASLHSLHGQPMASLICDLEDLGDAAEIVALLEQKVGRVLVNGYPTGVELSAAIVHGGPYPATSDACGSFSIERWLRPICYQNVPDQLLPDALKNANQLGIVRLINGGSSREAMT
jgi:2,5-dioxopentanoate dehydrogenase